MRSLPEIIRDNRPPAIIGIDPAISCGWCVGDVGRPAAIRMSGTWDLEPRGSEHPGTRYARLRMELRLLGLDYSPLELIVYESSFHRGEAATKSHAGLIGIILAVAVELGRIPVLSVNNQKLKAHAGTGAADKEHMIRMARGLFRREPATSDEADAMFLYDYGRIHLLQPQREGQWQSEKRATRSR